MNIAEAHSCKDWIKNRSLIGESFIDLKKEIQFIKKYQIFDITMQFKKLDLETICCERDLEVI